MQITRRARAALLTLTAITAATALAACSSSSSTSTSAPGSAGGTSASSASGGTYTFWDPYPQYNASSAWWKVVAACGTQAGVTIKHTAYDTTALTTQALLAGQQGKSPNILLIDNPVVSTLASAGILTTTAQNGLSTGHDRAEHPRRRRDQRQDLRRADRREHAGALLQPDDPEGRGGQTRPPSRAGPTLTAALAKVKAIGKKGITFSGINTEEGSFQFLPWFWGAGRQPDQPRLAAGGRRAHAVDHLDQGRLRAELRDPEHADHLVAGVPDRRLRVRRERHLAEGRRRHDGREGHLDPGRERRRGAGADRRRVLHDPRAEGHRRRTPPPRRS